MAIDPSVIQALTTAVEAEPANAALRLHLAGLLLESGDSRGALEHAGSVLSSQPDSLEALRLASKAAEAAGEQERARSYIRLFNALMGQSAKSLVEEAFADAEPPVELPRSELGNTALDDPPDERRRMPQSHEPHGERLWDTERPEMTLSDVAGMESVKRRLNVAFLAPMRNPDIRKLYGKSLRGGLLLYGPPGCGKTFIARATAGELGARFMAIGLTDVVDMWIGQSEKNLHEVFETARRNRPCVLFFDEIDALGRRRSLLRESAGRDVVNQLLAEMDNVDSSNEGVFVLAATNHPWDVDSALRRPGRLDRTLLVLPPDSAAREAILKLHLRDRPVEGIDMRWLAAQTEGYSGADVAHTCESAAEHALEDSLDRGITRPIQMGDFKRALKEVRPSVRPWFDTAKNYALFANEGGVYDELLDYLRSNRLL
jgi:SpoVK/Ycf46/Vps4 family AAA+-type ATPase